MTVAAPLTPARLFTAFGAAVHVDPSSGELRHGPIGPSPANVVLIADGSLASPLHGRLVSRTDAGELPIACAPTACRADRASAATPLELVPLERGLFGLRRDDLFLCAELDGRVTLSRSTCSTWECFLASEPWPGRDRPQPAPPHIDRWPIKHFLIDPVSRARSGARAERAKLLIYGYPQWSHGRVYYDLCKRIHSLGYIADILNWQLDHSDSINDLSAYYETFMTSPDGVVLLHDTYGVPYERMVVVSHHEFDIRMLIEQKGVEIFDQFGGFGVVSYSVYSSAMMQGVRRAPKIVPLGIDVEEFHAARPQRLETVGYASSMKVTTFGVEWKRGHLAEAAAREANLPLKVAGSTANQMSFHDMPEFYRGVDAVLTTSLSESGPLTVMEAAAAGRLVISTPVGHFPLKAYQGGGVIAPIEPEKFVAFTADTLRYYQANPNAFVEKCESIQEAAKLFDWRHTLDEWVSLIDSAVHRAA